MKKRVITGMMTASVIVSLAGCGAGQKENVESTAPATMTETVAASQVETAEVTETGENGAGRPGQQELKRIRQHWKIFIRIIFCRTDQN